MRKSLLFMCCGALAACGGSGASTLAPEAFTSWDNVPMNGTVRLEGAAKAAAYTYNLLTDVVDVDQFAADDDAFLDITFKNGEATRVVVGNTNAPIDINEADGAVYGDFGVIIAGQSADGQDTIVAADVDALGYQYQNFGLWLTGYNTGAGTVGAGSFGIPTTPGDVPVMDLPVTYTGYSAGFVTDGSGYAGTVSDIEAEVFFSGPGGGGIVLSSTNTELIDIDTLAFVRTAGELDFESADARGLDDATFGGVMLNYDSGSFNSLVEGEFSIEGQFYGPNWDELGGTFAGSRDGTIYVGSFGAD